MGQEVSTAADKDFKMKLNLSLAEDHPFSYLQLELKRRGLKNLDLNKLMSEIFSEISEKWWEEKLDTLTPLEYKVSQAMANPEMRKKFNDLLA
jgi:hypothetical protein